jgi:ADP-ribose pyrophosphatase YjhB (NUDIX family)
MTISPFMAELRARVGNTLLLLPSVTGCVFDEGGRLLIAKHNHIGTWSPPGGGLEPDEVPDEAVVREIREEVSLEIEVRGLIGVYGGPDFRTTYLNGDRVSYMIAVYGCVPVGGELKPDGEEIHDARFVTQDEVGGFAMSRWTPHVLPDAFAWARASL